MGIRPAGVLLRGLMALALAGTLGCKIGGGGATPDGGAADASDPAGSCTEDKVMVMFASVCAMGGCHTAAEKPAGIDLESPDLVARLAAQDSVSCGPLLVPGSAQDSLLVSVMAPSPACGVSMPPALPLVPSDVDCVASWIDGLPSADPP